MLHDIILFAIPIHLTNRIATQGEAGTTFDVLIWRALICVDMVSFDGEL